MSSDILGTSCDQCRSTRFNKSHIRKVYACLAVTCHLHFWQNDRDFLRATVVTRGGTDTEIRVSTESRPWRRKFSRRSSRDSNPRPFNHESGALTTELSPPPGHWYLPLCIYIPFFNFMSVHSFFLFFSLTWYQLIRRNGRRYQHVLALCALLTGGDTEGTNSLKICA